MVKYLKIIPVFLLLFSCVFPYFHCPKFPLPICYRCYRIPENKDYERLVKLEMFKLKEPMQPKDFKIIDTTAIYKESYHVRGRSDKMSYPCSEMCNGLKFYKDGHFAILYNVKERKDFIFKRNRFSVSTYGRFVLDGNKIKIEQFYPISGGMTNYFCKEYGEGIIINDTIKLKLFSHDVNIYFYTKLK